MTQPGSAALGAKTIWGRYFSPTLKIVSWNLRRFDALIPWIVGAAVFLLSLRSPQTPPWLTSACRPGCGSYLHVSSVPAVILAGFSAVAAGFGQRARWPLYVTAGAGWLLFSMWPAIAAASYYTGLKVNRKGPLLYAVAAGALVLGGAGRATVAVELLAFVVVLPLMVGLWLRSRREEQVVLQDMRADHARELERRRIAREMHDLVAHRVSLMVLHAGALELAAPDRRTAETAALITCAGREAMDELRQALGVLREPAGAQPQHTAQHTLAELPDLIERTSAAGLPVTLETQVNSVPHAVSRTAFRIVQEALTNVVKHAGAVPTQVSVCQQANSLVVTVHNGPPEQRHERLPGAGLGLVGLRERVELLGGTLQTARHSSGDFTLSARMPLREGT